MERSVCYIYLLFMCVTPNFSLPNGRRQMGGSGSPGYECTVENYACSDMSDNNLISEVEDTQTNEGCKQRCIETNDCTW